MKERKGASRRIYITKSKGNQPQRESRVLVIVRCAGGHAKKLCYRASLNFILHMLYEEV